MAVVTALVVDLVRYVCGVVVGIPYLWDDGPSSSSCRCHRWHRFSSLVIAVVNCVGLPLLSSESSFLLVIALPSLPIELIVLVVPLFYHFLPVIALITAVAD